MKIIITIEVPEGVQVAVAQNGHESQYVPPFADELVPLPEGVLATYPGDMPATSYGPADEPVFRGAATAVASRDFCPVHHVPWKTVPAGVSKKTGNTYAAFRACPERGCDQRPA